MRDEMSVIQTAVENAVDSRNIEIAKKMKSKGKSIDEIIDFTSLTKEQIDKL